METMIHIIAAFILITNIIFFGTLRYRVSIALLATQGFLLSAMPLVTSFNNLSFPLLIDAFINFFTRSLLFPWLLNRACQRIGMEEEPVPLLTHVYSMLAALVVLGASAFANELPLRPNFDSPVIIPMAVMTVLTGLFAIITRRSALGQILGYLVLEHGVYLFEFAFIEMPLPIDIGLLFNLIIAVIVLIASTRLIHNEYKHINTNELRALKG